MPDPLDYRAELRELASLSCDPAAIDAMLARSLDALHAVVPYDLASVLELDDRQLRVRCARGPLADARVRAHAISLADFPTVRQALENRRPVALETHHHASEEGDPYDGVLDLPDGHACMVVPLFAGERTLGVMTLDRSKCVRYAPGVVELAGVYGQLVALALAYAEQARRLDGLVERLREENRLLTADVEPGETSRSPAMNAVLRQARLVAETDAAVLVGGETGTGKEVMARAIHRWSPRRDAPFVSVNCAAIPEALVEAELFGHTRGAFSGAVQARPGRFLTANGGTLLLDEIGDLPLSAQGKLLRVLQEGTFEPVGSDKTVRVDVRVLAATHVDLEAAVRAKKFREDLYYRLAVFPLRLPPLRDRGEDLPELSASILAGIARRTGRGPWTLSPEALAWLRRQPWPGNVRQLVNALERATILHPRGRLGVEAFGGPAGEMRAGDGAVVADGEAGTGGAAMVGTADWPALDEVERRYIKAVLERTGGRVYGAGGAAEILGLKPSTLQSRMERLGVARVG